MAQKARPRALVSLTYDGTQLCHAETVLGQLTDLGLTATFYADPVPMLDSLPTWRQASESGNEIGNGCLVGSLDGGSVLAAWTPEMVADDIDETDGLLREVLPGQNVFSLGFPWVQGKDTSLEDVKRIAWERHSVCRSGVSGLNPVDSPDLGYLKCVQMDGFESEHMIDLVRTAIRAGTWIVLAFDGVGSGDRAVDASAHLGLCRWLNQNTEFLEVLPLYQAAEKVGSSRRPRLSLL